MLGAHHPAPNTPDPSVTQHCSRSRPWCRSGTQQSSITHVVEHGPGRRSPGDDGFRCLPQVLWEGSQHRSVDHRRQLVVPCGGRRTETTISWSLVTASVPHPPQQRCGLARQLWLFRRSVASHGRHKNHHSYNLPAPSPEERGTWSSSSQQRKAEGKVPCSQHTAGGLTLLLCASPATTLRHPPHFQTCQHSHGTCDSNHRAG